MKSFYFVRHGETDFNARRIFHNGVDASLNDVGRKQAEEIAPIVKELPIKKVYRSPLKRVGETHAIITQNLFYETVIVDEFSECPENMWEKFVDWEKHTHKPPFCSEMTSFRKRVEIGLAHVFRETGPHLVVAHGGVHWMIAHILDVPGYNRRIPNCGLVYFYQDSNKVFQAKLLHVKQ